MAKWKKTIHAEILKSKEDGALDYMKVKEPMVAGVTYNLENKASQLASLKTAGDAGKLSSEQVTEMSEKINNRQDFVRFQITKLTKED
tara:strand:+ start:10675 stop:10938 length:264 start_codon:yes stop_codon:yes gene_type:complete